MTETVFEAHRDRLTLLAYRMCGAWADAEDVVQTVATEWLRTASITNPAGWLTKVTVRRSIDALRARERRPAYVGPWLPEPLIISDEGPYRRLEEREALSTAFLVLAESLTPPQRAAVVLRALGYDFAEIAEILELGLATCRQHHSRAMRRLSELNGRDAHEDPALALVSTTAEPRGSRELAAELLAAFLRAARRGEVAELTGLLHEHVIAYQDGGGKVRAARRPLIGTWNVARFVAGVADLNRDRWRVRPVYVGGDPGAILTLADSHHVLSVQVRDGRIYRIFDVCTPEKLSTLGEPPPGS